MPIPTNINPLGIVKNKGYRCLTFVAQENNCTVSLNIIKGSPVVSGLQYRLQDKGAWIPYSCGTVITLSNIDDIVQFQNTNNTLNTLDATTIQPLDSVRFVTSGKIGLYGDITSMVNYSTTIPQHSLSYLFSGTSIVSVPEISLYKIEREGMLQCFSLCDNLTQVSNISVKHLYGRGFQRMFYRCKSLVNAPNINIDNSYDYYGCREMFRDCPSLLNPPEKIGATLHSEYAMCEGMFYGCSKLIKMPIIVFPTDNDINDMRQFLRQAFYNCTSLKYVTDILALVLGKNALTQTFYGCSSMTTAPYIKATTIDSSALTQTFYGCSKLNYVKVDFTAWSSTTSNWLYGVSPTGTFECPSTLDTTNRNSNYIPENWTVVNS